MNTTDEEIEKLAPKDTLDNPAYPNHSDTDIWIAGFKAALSQNKVSDVTDWDVVLGQYSKDRDLSINDVRYALIPFVKWLKENYSGKVSDAVEFAEWFVLDNSSNRIYESGDDNDGKWYDEHESVLHRKYYTTQQLYEIFKSEKPQITSK